jgi:hypothetical protein
MKTVTWSLLGDVKWRPSDHDSSTFLYLPTSPGPVLDPAGRPSLNLLLAGEKAYLALSAQWDPPAERLEQLRAQLADLNSELDPALIKLAPPQLEVGDITLGTQAGGRFHELRTVRSSGFPPWTAAFNLELDEAATEAAQAALAGRRKRLLLRFKADLEGRAVEFWSDVGAWFASDGDRGEVVHQNTSSHLEGEDHAQDR